MNDRFRFRAWDKSFHKYCENVIVSTINGEVTVYGRLVNGRTSLIPNSHVVLEQCTGLKDKNGKLIYEGDIIASRFQGQLLAANIKYYRAGFVAEFHYWKPILYQICNEGKFEVIGNIHENPELLGGRK